MQKPPKKGTVAWQAYKAEQRLAKARAEIARLLEEISALRRALTEQVMQSKAFEQAFVDSVELKFDAKS